ncbi:MAG TPA: sodium:solute symporter family protein [Candidatus Hydrogenedentes bacterium]|nr:sodium:solute symporter family protein [Candidatus Hydrogenedentota bacterium]
MTQSLGQPIDYIVMLGYFGAVVLFGMYFSRYTRSTKDFFLGGQRFAWWLIAFSGIATTVGSYSFVKYSDVGFKYGISSTQSYLNDWFWMPILMLIWLPIIYYARVTSVPEYFERRFGSHCRVASTLIILTYLVAYIGVNLFTLGQVFESLLGWRVMVGAAVTAVAVTLYVVAGGQTSVIMTDLAQGIILLVVGLGILFAGVWHFGGFGDFWGLLPTSHKFAFSELTDPPKFSALGIYVQDGIINTGAFVLMNQGMIMRFLSLKSVEDARKMAVCWILVLAPIAAIATAGGGWIARGLVENGELETPSQEAFVRAAHFLCAPGIFGFVLAALTAALMSTADTLINAVSAVFVNDIWKPFVQPKAQDKHLLLVARIVSVGAAVVGLAFVLIYVRAYESIYQAHAMVTASIPAPMVVAVLLGILWKRFTPTACFVTLVGGSAAMGLTFIHGVDDALIGPLSFGMGRDSYTFMRALYGVLVCGALGVSVSFFTKPKATAEVVGLVTGTELEAMRRYKGSEVNRRPGKKVRLRVKVDDALAGSELAVMPQDALDGMAAGPGDLVYAADVRWWFGGLRSVHLKVGEVGEESVIRMGPDALDGAHFRDGQDVVVEKIM